MASYKVIQDIEAEDKLVGPLTLRQFIFAGISALCAYLSFIALAKGFSLALIVLLPPMVFAGFFAFPFGRDQPTEVWALAKIRYYLKSHKRLWDQSGVKDLVEVTAPKHETKQLTNNLSQHDVQSRLTALAHTLDSRGWAVKNEYAVPQILNPSADTDRLLDINAMPQQVPVAATMPADDMLDEDNNPRAQQLSTMIASSTADHKQRLRDAMSHGSMPSLPEPKVPVNAAEHWFMPGAATPATAVPSVIGVNQDTAGEAALSKALHKRREAALAASADEHLKTIEPLGHATNKQPATTAQPPVTPPANPATINLSKRDDLNIATIARVARQNNEQDEVVISLHGRQ